MYQQPYPAQQESPGGSFAGKVIAFVSVILLGPKVWSSVMPMFSGYIESHYDSELVQLIEIIVFCALLLALFAGVRVGVRLTYAWFLVRMSRGW